MSSFIGENPECPRFVYWSNRYDTTLVRDIDESALVYVGLFHKNCDPGMLQSTGYDRTFWRPTFFWYASLRPGRLQ